MDYRTHNWFMLFLRQVLVFITSLAIVAVSVMFAVNWGYNRYILPVDNTDEMEVLLDIPMGSTVNRIGQILEEHNIIRSAVVFRIYVELTDKGSSFQAGRYGLRKNMTLNEITNELTTGMIARETKQIVIPEGRTIREIARYLSEEMAFSFSEKDFVQAANPQNYLFYDFLSDIPDERMDLDYPMEGYLFPDTYSVYADASPQEIIKRMLERFNQVFNIKYLQRALELGMTVDEVITMASMVQQEARVLDEFPKISAVMHNRIRINMPLQIDATVLYALGGDTGRKNRLLLSIEDTRVDSPYNTYRYAGLPIGPIAAPGRTAIEAVLYPDETDMNIENPMLYYVLKDPVTGEHAFNSTYEGHIRDRDRYSDNWR